MPKNQVKMLLIIPFSMLTLKIFFNIIKTIGPTNSPNIPINLKPVYIAIKVKIGCMPILLLTIRGSNNCLTIIIIAKITIIAIPSFKSPFNASIIAQGTITVPEPKIGKASTNPTPIAPKSGYGTLNPRNLRIYSPIRTIKNEITY